MKAIVLLIVLTVLLIVGYTKSGSGLVEADPCLKYTYKCGVTPISPDLSGVRQSMKFDHDTITYIFTGVPIYQNMIDVIITNEMDDRQIDIEPDSGSSGTF